MNDLLSSLAERLAVAVGCFRVDSRNTVTSGVRDELVAKSSSSCSKPVESSV
jgi:hypothetical protein